MGLSERYPQTGNWRLIMTWLRVEFDIVVNSVGNARSHGTSKKMAIANRI